MVKAMLNGIDVSRWQPVQIAAMVPCDFVIIKASEGTRYVSATFPEQYRAARLAKKLRGLYHFADGGDPIQEADHFIATVKKHIGKAVLVLDFEAGAVGKWGDAGALRFLNRVRQQTKVTPFIYASRSVLDRLVKVHAAGFPAWEAQYDSNAVLGGYQPPPQGGAGPWTAVVIHQYTSHLRLKGYGGNLDGDVAYLTRRQWRRYARGMAGKAPAPTRPAQQKTKPKSHAARRTYRVASGDTLSGIARRFYGSAGRYPAIAKVNGIRAPYLIHVGQVLTLP
jgi:lysozyme